jgi:hypothetical protein
METKKEYCLKIRSDTPPDVTATVAAVGVSLHGLWRNVLTRFCVFGSALHIKKDVVPKR